MLKRIVNLMILIFCLSFSATGLAGDLDDLSLLTEYYPPYNYDHDGKIKGISVDLLAQALKRAGAELDRSEIKLEAWSKAYKRALNHSDTLLFSTTRSKKREGLFKWVGPITEDNTVLFVKKDKGIKIDNLRDIKDKGYKIGVVKDDVSVEQLKRAGVPDENLAVRAFPGLNLMELYKGEIDAWAYSSTVARWMCGIYGFDSSDYVSAYTLKKAELFYALNQDTPDSVVRRLQKAVDEIKAEGGFKAIYERYN